MFPVIVSPPGLGVVFRYVRTQDSIDSQIELTQKLIDTHFVVPGDALQDARQRLDLDGAVHGDYFVMFAIDLRRDP